MQTTQEITWMCEPVKPTPPDVVIKPFRSTSVRVYFHNKSWENISYNNGRASISIPVDGRIWFRAAFLEGEGFELHTTNRSETYRFMTFRTDQSLWESFYGEHKMLWDDAKAMYYIEAEEAE